VLPAASFCDPLLPFPGYNSSIASALQSDIGRPLKFTVPPMSQAVRKLTPGEVVIGFINPNGELVGELVDVAVGHEAHSYSVSGLRARLSSGRVIAVTIGKSSSGEIRVFGSGMFPPPGGGRLNPALCELASRLVE